MRWDSQVRRVTVAWGVLAAVLAVALSAAAAWGAPPAKRLPPFSAVNEAVLRHFESLPTYRPNGLIARSEVEALFKRLERIGWSVADREAIAGRVLPDGDFLVQQLRTEDGEKFMLQVAGFRQGYDRLDRLSRLSNGRQMVRDLIRGPDGYKMVEYLATSSGGSEMGTMLSKAPNGADFNKPTGRIYTVSSLLEQLKKAHEAAQPRATKAKPAGS